MSTGWSDWDDEQTEYVAVEQPEPSTEPLSREDAMDAMDAAVVDAVAQEDEAATMAPPTPLSDTQTLRVELLGARLEPMTACGRLPSRGPTTTTADSTSTSSTRSTSSEVMSDEAYARVTQGATGTTRTPSLTPEGVLLQHHEGHPRAYGVEVRWATVCGNCGTVAMATWPRWWLDDPAATPQNRLSPSQVGATGHPEEVHDLLRHLRG